MVHRELQADGQLVAEHPQPGAAQEEPWVRSDEAELPGAARSEARRKKVEEGVKQEPWRLSEPVAEAERKGAESERWRDVRSAA